MANMLTHDIERNGNTADNKSVKRYCNWHLPFYSMLTFNKYIDFYRICAINRTFI